MAEQRPARRALFALILSDKTDRRSVSDRLCYLHLFALVLFQFQQSINFGPVKSHDDFAANIEHRYTLLATAPHQIPRGIGILTDIHISEPDTTLA